METKFLDIAHLYMGCKVKVENVGYINGGYIGTTFGVSQISKGELLVEHELGSDGWEEISNCKPILKHLSEATEEEFIEIGLFTPSPFNKWEHDFKVWLNNKQDKDFSISQFTYLLSKGYDLHNLIETGQAINAKTV